MLACVAVAVARREIAWCAAGGVIALGVRTVLARGQWTPSGRFGLANAVTWLRLGLVAGLPLLERALPRIGFVAAIVALLGLDALDGRLARARGEASPFGASLDMETDALSVMILSLLLWQRRGLGAWVLAAGLWRWVYASIVVVVPALGEAPRSRFARWVFVILMGCLTSAFLTLPSLLAAIGTALVSISFLRSLWQSLSPRG